MRKRERRSREEWKQIVAEQRSSGTKVSGWCRERGISRKSFYQWRGKLESHESGFIRVEANAGPATTLTVQTPDGYRIEVPRGVEASQVRTLLRALERR